MVIWKVSPIFIIFDIIYLCCVSILTHRIHYQIYIWKMQIDWWTEGDQFDCMRKLHRIVTVTIMVMVGYHTCYCFRKKKYINFDTFTITVIITIMILPKNSFHYYHIGKQPKIENVLFMAKLTSTYIIFVGFVPEVILYLSILPLR